MDKKFKTFVIISLILITCFVGIGGFLILKMVLGESLPFTFQEKDKEIVYLALDEPIISNLKEDSKGYKHVIKIAMSLSMESNDLNKTFIDSFDDNQIIIRDTVIQTLRTSPIDMFFEPGAPKQLSEVLLEALKLKFEPIQIDEIYFSDFFVQ